MAAGFSAAGLAHVSAALRAHVDSGAVAGVVALLARHGQAHVEVAGVQDLATGAPMRRDTLFRICSMTKPVAAAAALMLVEEGRLRLDDPVERLLPELANRRVLRRLDGPLDDTVPARRSITLRDLLTFRLGFGAIMAPSAAWPIQRAVDAAGIGPGPDPPACTPDEFVRRFAALPLMHQPGERWMYHTGSDILAVLVARAAGMPFDDLLRERIFTPLGMADTGYVVPDARLPRLATCYRRDATGRLAPRDDGSPARACRFPAGGTGLVSTVDDYLAFARALLGQGPALMSRTTLAQMTSDQIAPAQKAASPFFPGFWDTNGWGFGVSMATAPDAISAVPGRYGWDGGFGTTWRNDPHTGLTAILLIQREMTSPGDSAINDEFLRLAWRALDG